MPRMNFSKLSKKIESLGGHWEMVAVTVVLFVLVAVFVDLRPHVDENFFFSARDPQFRQSQKIEEKFPSRPELILAVESHEIGAARYLERIGKLTRAIEEIDGVASVKSLAAGPKSFADALASPFWNRLLIAKDRQSTNVIAFVATKDTEKLIRRIESVVREMDARDFRIHLAGSP